MRFLGEDDFIEVMGSENRKWRDEHVKQGTVKTKDGTGLNYYCALPDEPRSAVVIVHGFCEFWGKYHEYAWYLYQAGFSVYFMEQRGFGLSEGKLKEWDIVYIDDYDTYVEDLKTFLDEKVLPETKGLKKFLLAHSMGGAVSALFLEKYPEYFDRAVLSTPMLKMNSDFSPFFFKIFGIWSALFNKRKQPAPGQERFSRIPDFENSCSLSRSRYDYVFNMRLEDEHYQTSTASIGWGIASFKSHKRIMDNASKIKIPITVITAGNDTLIDPAGYRMFGERVKQAVFTAYEGSKHEIFNADDGPRTEYFKQVLNIFKEAE